MNLLATLGAVAMFSVLMAIATPAQADCTCACVNGQVEALCSSSIDLKPLCAMQLCPMTPLSITPIKPLTLPPLGTTSCHQAQVLNPYTRQYQWQTVCN